MPPHPSSPPDAAWRLLRAQARAGWDDLRRDADLRRPAGWALVARRIGPKRLLLGGGALLALLVLLLPGGTSSADPFDGPGALLDLFLKLGVVVGLAYASLALLRRYTVGATRSGSLLRVLDSTTLAPNRSVYVVRAGEKRLVLGVTTAQITMLAELEPEGADPSALDAGAANGTGSGVGRPFAAHLIEARRASADAPLADERFDAPNGHAAPPGAPEGPSVDAPARPPAEAPPPY